MTSLKYGKTLSEWATGVQRLRYTKASDLELNPPGGWVEEEDTLVGMTWSDESSTSDSVSDGEEADDDDEAGAGD